MAFAPDGKMLATMARSEPRLWDADTGRPGQNLELCNLDPMITFRPSIYFSDDHRIEVPSFTDYCCLPLGKRTLTFWDTRTGKASTVMSPLGSPQIPAEEGLYAQGYALSPDGRWQLWGAEEEDRFTLVDRSTKKIVRCLKLAHDGRFPFVALSSDGQSILSSSYREVKANGINRTKKGIDVWSTATGKLSMSIEVRTKNDWCMALSPDGRRVAAAFDEEPSIRLWEVASGTEGEKFQTAGTVCSIAWSPDGRFLASGDEKGDLCFWDVTTMQEARHFTGHRGKLTALVFSADELRLASGSSDTTAMVWDLRGLPSREAKAVQLPPTNDLWAALREKEVVVAWPAMRFLTQNPDVALPLLRERLWPVSLSDPKRVTELLAQLDDDNYKVRNRAAEQLEKMGESVEQTLQEALAKKPSPEVQNHIESLLDKIAGTTSLSGLSPSQLQAYRGVEVLERIGTPAARVMLEELSRLPEGLVQTREARAALQRLRKPPVASMP